MDREGGVQETLAVVARHAQQPPDSGCLRSAGPYRRSRQISRNDTLEDMDLATKDYRIGLGKRGRPNPRNCSYACQRVLDPAAYDLHAMDDRINVVEPRRAKFRVPPRSRHGNRTESGDKVSGLAGERRGLRGASPVTDPLWSFWV